MTAAKKIFHRTVIEVEVLSEDPYELHSLERLQEDITTGDCSGHVYVKSHDELSTGRMAEALQAQGSCPEFLGITLGENDEHAASA